ncbi:hypothetical protein EBR21_16975, partial [bacterium]|nr:hypothetical protein [bacterium]
MVCWWASHGVAQAANTHGDTFLKFRNESALSHYLQQHPESSRVHPGLMWVQTSAAGKTFFTENVQQQLGIETVEGDHTAWHIPKPVTQESLAAD